MSFIIVLSNNFYRALEPGHLLCGIVKFTTEAETYVESVAISFTGQTIVSLSQPSTTNSAHTHQSCGILFRLNLVLQGEKRLCRKGTQTWPFAFLVPSHASFAPGGHFSSTAEHFDCELPWRGSSDAETLRLPPSMSYNAAFMCSVQYGLHARLLRPPTSHLFGSHNLSVYASVKLNPSSTASSMPYNLGGGSFQPIDHNLGGAKPWRFGLLPKLPFKPRISNERKSSISQNESKKLMLRVHIPKTLNPRCDLPVRMFLCAIPSDSGQHSDGVFLKSFSLDLIIHTRVRVESRQETENRALNLIRGSQQKEIPCISQSNNGTLTGLLLRP